MFAEFGSSILVITFILALYSIGAALFGQFRQNQKWVESARLAMLLTFPLLTVTSLVLIYLLVTNDFSVKFVYEVTSTDMPTYLKVTALWGGAGRVAALLVLADGGLCLGGDPAQVGPRP